MAAFTLPCMLTCIKWNRYAIKVLPWLEAKDLENGGSQVSMRRDTRRDPSLCNSGTTDHKRNVYIFLIAALLSRWQTVLSDVKAIVATIYQVRIVEDVMLVECLDNSLHELIDGLKSPKSQAIELIVVLDIGLVLSSQLANPTGTAWLVRPSASGRDGNLKGPEDLPAQD